MDGWYLMKKKKRMVLNIKKYGRCFRRMWFVKMSFCFLCYLGEEEMEKKLWNDCECVIIVYVEGFWEILDGFICFGICILMIVIRKYLGFYV